MRMASMRESRDGDRFLVNTQIQSHALLRRGFGTSVPFIRAVIMSQECTQPSMQMFPSVINYFSTGLAMTLQSQCICIS